MIDELYLCFFFQNLVESTNVELPENATDTSDSNSSANNLLQLELSNMLKTSNFDNSSVQRTSLPDIPLTNREREIINNETTSIRTFYSTDSILSDCIPPPKPPYPARYKTFQLKSFLLKFNELIYRFTDYFSLHLLHQK